ncbi:NADP-dependent 3-hydroxy acid dehydrogenase YdfG [Halarchaeum rubridurum]|uniref:NADP-dependent 3-hydroxy acid dehydrogenase YdfG n=1 Tax=Halarchaeum rubridurum TaxID=489911 RepID=A0A830FK20_9EURY|nr:SDR family NAD(P)-dependent oxidoreductase [Halarchaeum rubridurum]MBP1953803.1 NADP-dependent 3-hydroxy acid dehydrogenase YdfG [Halarchaeum rubridurum]GGM54821.1 oxidoreductase [Halarchaeum rubridurum]
MIEDDSVALVTGASSGIGAETAVQLAEAGADVALAARREDRLREVAERVEATGSEALVVPADVSERDEVVRMVADTVDELGGLDVLVNNAGVMLLEAVADADPANWRTMIEVNLIGLMNATKEALPHLRDGGHVINVSSVAGRVAGETSSGYSATKFGVNAFTEGLRQEEADDGLRTTLIEPGFVETELADHIPDEDIQDHTEEMLQEMDVLQPEDIARAIVYATDQPEHVSVNELMVRPTGQAQP